MHALLTVLVRIRRRVLLHRRALAALCAGLAALVTVSLLRPSPPPTVPVWVAARDVAAGEALEPDDLRSVRWPAALAPASALSSRDDRDRLVGRTAVVPVQRGQPVTVRSVLGDSALTGHPGRDVIAVRVHDTDVAGLLVPGDEIDLWVTDPRAGGGARQVVTGARVVAVPPVQEGVLASAGNGRSTFGESTPTRRPSARISSAVSFAVSAAELTRTTAASASSIS